MGDYTDLYGKRMTPEQYEEFCQGLREDLHRIGQIKDDERTKIEIYRLFARLNGHKFPETSGGGQETDGGGQETDDSGEGPSS